MKWPAPLRILLFALPVILGLQAGHARAQHCDRPSVGAIRWDAWHGDDSEPGKAVERSLGHEKWKDRWPDFYTVEPDGIEFDGTRPEVVEREMRLAREAGIDYWAFVFYGAQSPMGRVLRTFMQSTVEGPAFALVIEFSRLLGEPGKTFADDARAVLRHPRYLRDADGRPLVYVWVPAKPLAPQTIALGFGRLLAAGDDTAGPAPAFVVMSFSAGEAAKVARAVGSDRISTYAWHDNPAGAPYRDLARGTEAMWERQAATGARVVPLVMTGWDPRPRIENPVPWGGGYPKGAYYQSPTPDELADHVRNAVAWARRSGQRGCSALIYAWNEFDEGGWIAPTRGGRDLRLRAIKIALAPRLGEP